MSRHHGWRTYRGHGVNNCLALLSGVYKHRGHQDYFTYQTQELLSEWSGVPQQRISEIISEYVNGVSIRDANYYSMFRDTEERNISDIIHYMGGTTVSLLEITANKYGYKFSVYPRPGCIIDVYDYKPCEHNFFTV